MKLLYQLPAHLGLPAAWSTRTGHCRPQKERSCSPGWCHELRFVQHGSVRCYPPCCQYHCPTTSSKKVLYRLGNKYTDQQSATAGLYWLSPTQGFEIGGSPVSIPQYMSSHLNKCVDGIIAELTRFEEFINIPVGSPKARLQLVYALIRLYTSQQLCYHLCYTFPSATALSWHSYRQHRTRHHQRPAIHPSLRQWEYTVMDSSRWTPPSAYHHPQSHWILHISWDTSCLRCDSTCLADVTFSEMWTAHRSKIQLQNLPPAHAAAIQKTRFHLMTSPSAKITLLSGSTD